MPWIITGGFLPWIITGGRRHMGSLVRGAATGLTWLGRHARGLVLGAGTGLTRLERNTGGPVLGRGTGYTGPWRHTGDLELRPCTTRPGWVVTLARHVRGAGTGRTGLCRRAGDTVRRAGAGYPSPRKHTGGLESRAGTISLGWMLTLARQMRGAGMERTGLRTRTGDTVRSTA